MANVYNRNPMVLDTFTGVVNVGTQLNLPTGFGIKLNFIEWMTPTSAGDTCLITDAASGNPIFSETCVTANQSMRQYYHGMWVKNLYIAISGVQSGKVQIGIV
jgi:hypothetical protein